MSEKELKPGKPSPSLAPAYCAIYPDIAELVRKHGYALSIHGSLRRDFDLVCIPWADAISTPDEVVDAITKEFGFKRDKYPTQKNHGRICYTIHISWGECRFDLSFVLQPATPPGEAVPEDIMRLLSRVLYLIENPDLSLGTIDQHKKEAAGILKHIIRNYCHAQQTEVGL